MLLLPNLNAGANYHGHVGNLERSSGRILSTSPSSRCTSAAVPVPRRPGRRVCRPLTCTACSWPTPSSPALAARQLVAGARFAAAATANRVLREVAELHFDLLAAESVLGLARETAVQAAEVARLTAAYAEAKQGRQADAERSATELRLLEREVEKAEEDVAVMSTRLVRRLHVDPAVRVRPVAQVFETVIASSTRPPRCRARSRARSATTPKSACAKPRSREPRSATSRSCTGHSCRPSRSGSVAGRSAAAATWTPPLVGNFAGRTDFDVAAFWTLRNFGIGNLMLQKQRLEAQVGQAVGERSRAIAEVRTEVSSAYAETAAALREVERSLGTGGSPRQRRASEWTWNV